MIRRDERDRAKVRFRAVSEAGAGFANGYATRRQDLECLSVRERPERDNDSKPTKEVEFGVQPVAARIPFGGRRLVCRWGTTDRG